jgi:hypothetical protein
MPLTDPTSGASPRRRPSRLAVQLTDAFEPLTQWAEVRIVRDASGRRDRVITDPRRIAADGTPFDWADAA